MLPLRTVVVEVTERCNNACQHCYNYWRTDGRRDSERQLTRAELRALIVRVQRDVPLEQVALSGGEPLVRHDVEDVVGDFEALGLHTVVITNGTLLTTRRVHRFPPGTAFEITLFSVDEHVHNALAGRPVLACVLENIVRLRRQGHRFVLACVLTQRNVYDVARTIALGVALGAEGVLLNRVNLSRRLLVRAPHLVPTAAQLRAGLRAASALATRYGIPITASVPIPPCVADPRDYPGLHFGWCPRGGPESYYTIGVTGTIRPCNHASVVLGDLRRQGFADIVNSVQARRYWGAVPRECRACRHPLKTQCGGGCPAAADECYGDRHRRDPFVALSLARPTGAASVGEPVAERYARIRRPQE
jgi:pyrroloquinoline quinone biosynthesis protein E